MSSLRQRLNLGLAASLVLLFATQWVLIDVFAHRLGHDYVSSRLRHDAEGLLAALEPATDGNLQLLPTAMSPVYRRPYSGHYFVIELPGRRIRSRSLWDQTLPQPTHPREGHHGRYRGPGPQEQQLLLIQERFEKAGQALTVTVAEDITPLTDALAGLRIGWGLVSLAALVLLLVAQNRVVHRGLRPLERLRRQVTELDRGEVERLDGDTPDEVRPLVGAINDLLAVTARRLQRSREALGNLAHALKRPLGHLRQGLEGNTPLTDAERQNLQGAVDNIGRLIDRELKRARVAGSGRPGRRFHPADDLPPLAHAIERLYRDKAIDIQLHLDGDETTAFDRDDILELAGNLLDNAAKWCEHTVLVRCDNTDRLALSVEDDGPGCAPEQRRELLERGTRLDENRPGHGLGLNIVKAIVEDYAGHLQLDRSNLGGLQVTVTLPRTQTETPPHL